MDDFEYNFSPDLPMERFQNQIRGKYRNIQREWENIHET